MTKKDIGEIVQKYLEEQEYAEGYKVSVLAKEIRRQGAFWYVPILPTTQPRKMYAYYEALAEVEGKLDENDGLDVLLVPAIPEEAAAAA